MTWKDYFSELREKALNKEEFDQYVDMWGDYTERIITETDAARRRHYIQKRIECERVMMYLTQTGIYEK